MALLVSGGVQQQWLSAQLAAMLLCWLALPFLEFARSSSSYSSMLWCGSAVAAVAAPACLPGVAAMA
jgi:hypothetical protein